MFTLSGYAVNELTPKAERTRHLILSTALASFAQRGYEATTMRDVAAEAGVSLGLAYRYFQSKESLVLALYQQMAAETDAAIAQLPQGSIAERFVLTMTARLEQASPYRDTFGALFGAIMTPSSGVELFGKEAGIMRKQTEEAFISLVQTAKDAPNPAHVQDVGKLLYGMHFAVILFWLRDRTEGQRTTIALLNFIRDLLPWLLRGLALPFVGRELARFVRIIDGAFGSIP